jgi:hypothetical protein
MENCLEKEEKKPSKKYYVCFLYHFFFILWASSRDSLYFSLVEVELHQVYANSKFAIVRNLHSFSCFVTRAFLGQEAKDKIANSVFSTFFLTPLGELKVIQYVLKNIII